MDEQRIDHIFDRAGTDTVFLVKVVPGDYAAANRTILKHAGDADTGIIYVSVKQPYVYLHDQLQKLHVGEDNLQVVDTITKRISDEGVVPRDYVQYLSGPQNLHNIGTAVSVAAKRLNRDHMFLVIDSLESLITYNTESSVATFLHDIKDRVGTLGIRLILFKQDPALDKQIGSHLYNVVDKVLLASGGAEPHAQIVSIGDETATLEIPIDVARSLDWGNGDDLSYQVKPDGRLILRES